MCVRICLGHSAVRKYLSQDQIRSSTRTKNELQNWMGNQELWRAGSDHSQIECYGRSAAPNAERLLPNLPTRVRFPSPAPILSRNWAGDFVGSFAGFVHS